MESIVEAMKAPFEPLVVGALGQVESLVEKCHPLAEQTAVLRSTWLETEADKLGAGIGLDSLTTRYVLVLFAAYPLSIVMRNLPEGAVRQMWSLFWGVFFAQFVFASGWAHAAVSGTVVYLIHLLPLPSKQVLTFVFMMTYISVSHIYRMYTDYMGWTLDFTGPQMILTIKLTLLAYNYYDGATNLGSTQKDADGPAGGRQRLAKRRLASSVRSWPNPLAYFAYVFDYGSFFAGPAMEFHDFDAGIYGTYLKSATETPPSAIVSSLTRLVAGIVFLGLSQFGAANFPMDQLYSPEFIANNAPWVRFGTALVCLFFVRCKYYFAWKVSEGGVVMAGFGYNTKTNAYDAVGNIDVLEFEYPSNLDSASRAWNKATQKWLASTVYTRTPRSLSMFATYSLSAFWHGFYPGYYLFFLSVIPAQKLGKLINARVRPLMFADEEQTKPKGIKFIYDHAGSILSHFALNYLAAVFVVLSWQRGLTLWTSWFFLGHIIFFSGLFLVPILVPKKKKSKKE